MTDWVKLHSVIQEKGPSESVLEAGLESVSDDGGGGPCAGRRYISKLKNGWARTVRIPVRVQ